MRVVPIIPWRQPVESFDEVINDARAYYFRSDEALDASVLMRIKSRIDRDGSMAHYVPIAGFEVIYRYKEDRK